MAPKATPATTRSNKVDDSKFDESVPTFDNQSASDVALEGDAISDKLEYAVHRTGLNPKLKILMAALRRARDVGDVKFRSLSEFVRDAASVRVFQSSGFSEPAYSLPTPSPSFMARFRKNGRA